MTTTPKRSASLRIGWTVSEVTRTLVVDGKRCSRCEEIKPRLDFYTNGRENDGRCSRCKGCANIATMESRSKNDPDRERAKRADHRKYVLCSACNLALGFAKDDPTRLRSMASYLESYDRHH